MTVQAPVARLSVTPGRIEHLGARAGRGQRDRVRRSARSGRRASQGIARQADDLMSRPRRSELATPASNEHMCEVAARSGADLVFLDLEDACAPAAKEAARATAVAALTELEWRDTARAIRINGLDTGWCHGDIIEVVTGAPDALDVIIVPKVRSGRDVWWVDALLSQLETRLGLGRRIKLEALIEEAEGLVNVAEIARASGRLEALIFGAATCPHRCGRASTGTSRRPAIIRVTTGTPCESRYSPPRAPLA